MTLRQGDRLYTETGWSPHRIHAPHAPVQPTIGGVLRTAFFHAHRWGRVRSIQTYGENLISLSTGHALSRTFFASVFTGIARAYSHVGRETSHIEVLVLFAIGSEQETAVSHKVTVIDASSNTDSATVDQVFDVNTAVGRVTSTRFIPHVGETPTSWSGRHQNPTQVVGISTTEVGLFIQQALISVPLSNISTQTPGVCEIRVEAKATFNGAAARYMPVMVMAYSDFDDFDAATLVDTAEGATTLSPIRFAPHEDVIFEHLRRAKRASAWSARYRPQNVLAIATGAAGWDDWSGGSAASFPLWELAPTSLETIVQTSHWSTTEQAVNGGFTFGAETVIPVGSTVVLTLKATGGLGTASTTITLTSADNGSEKTATLALTSVTNGGEWVDLDITMERTVGSGACEVRNLRVDEQELSGLSSPADS